MSIIILNNTILVEISPRYTESSKLTQIELNVLNNLWIDELLFQVQKFINKNPGIANIKVQIESDIIAQSLQLSIPPQETNAVEREALEISKEKIIAKLNSANLPTPANINLHAKALAQDESILAEARLRIEARLRAGIEMIKRGA